MILKLGFLLKSYLILKLAFILKTSLILKLSFILKFVYIQNFEFILNILEYQKPSISSLKQPGRLTACYLDKTPLSLNIDVRVVYLNPILMACRNVGSADPGVYKEGNSNSKCMGS